VRLFVAYAEIIIALRQASLEKNQLPKKDSPKNQVYHTNATNHYLQSATK
jgi:hypothetical protein